MRVWIDNNELQATDSVSNALDLARDHSEQSGRLIVDIEADGNPIDDAHLDNPPEDDAGINELRFTTTDPVAFLVETFASARESLALVREDQGTVADHLRTGELEPAVEALNAVLTGWQAVGDVVGQSAELAQIELEGFEFGGTKALDCFAKLGQTLSEVRDNLTQQDWSSLGDTIEYDLDEQAQQWDAMLDALTQRVQAGV
ncbi:MAG: hypothetical protein CMJ35_09225 [Phycisphaerae bacterium]|nr:hypothetical protein [Phycisphaerae bacterium]MBM91776.1 hypothetical protein [Phycisphaerae bacterium]|tara:strand:- start:1148 stop:1753 length:606 start_codon:yes stop_codon:yes gene_type:complete